MTLGSGLRARGNTAAEAYALSNLAMIHGDRRQFQRAHACMEDRERVAHEQLSLLGPLWVTRALVESWQGLWNAALATSARAEDIGQRIEGQYILGMSRLIGGHARFSASLDPSAGRHARRHRAAGARGPAPAYVLQLESPGVWL